MQIAAGTERKIQDLSMSHRGPFCQRVARYACGHAARKARDSSAPQSANLH